ncbi:zinc-binding dehydrogenase [Amycolatopsis rubida]|uniref:Threonine dehydrogenase n=1 Tax=Amycolatopsis rubida TaxID=112413 RepID=A0A1I6AGZ6_9PSEU|nr:zinc-binding dehydrogenase [Amycolatopsis rubida]SFQ67969.1 Threonine dehydrogenase [Amycolatopsis rubida]
MFAAVLHGPRDVRLDRVPDARIERPTDAVVEVALSAVCGTDLGGYLGVDPVSGAQRMGHEFVGVVSDVGRAVRSVRPGQAVLAPMGWSDGTCSFCLRGLPTSCRSGGLWGEAGADGCQAEAVRVPHADGTLVPVPGTADAELLRRVLPLADVLSAGHHAGVTTKVRPGRTVAVVGDGAVGLCTVLAARRLGAERIILMGTHAPRLSMAREFGVDDIVLSRDQAAIDEVRALTGGDGADAVIDAFGSEQSLATAVGVAKSGGDVCLVGVTGQPTWVDVNAMIRRNITLQAGVAPARNYLPELLDAVLADQIDASRLFDKSVPLASVADGYAAMGERSAIKVLVSP